MDNRSNDELREMEINNFQNMYPYYYYNAQNPNHPSQYYNNVEYPMPPNMCFIS